MVNEQQEASPAKKPRLTKDLKRYVLALERDIRDAEDALVGLYAIREAVTGVPPSLVPRDTLNTTTAPVESATDGSDETEAKE